MIQRKCLTLVHLCDIVSVKQMGYKQVGLSTLHNDVFLFSPKTVYLGKNYSEMLLQDRIHHI